ncbi:MAG: rod shape-determining protein MreC [Chloroflexota bacterium]|nr:rod shape-determining protein MreC [Chloroflexota bacterium]
MFATRASRRRGLTYAVMVAVSLLLLAFSNTAPMREIRKGFGFAFAPIQGALSGVTRGVSSVFGTIAEIDRLRGDNRELQARVQALEVENRRLAEIRVQNEQLSRLLQVRSALHHQTVAAEVIGRQVSQYERVVTLNQGADRGISVQDVVVAGGAALVGQVVEVGPNFSRVLLVSDTRSTVVGLIESSRATGEVEGQLGGALVMTKIPSTDRVRVDDTVVTAGIDLGNGIRSPFPKGLVIGRVVDVHKDPNAVVQTAFVDPAASLDKLEFVLVITDYEGGLPDPGPAGGARATASPKLEPAP